MDVPTRVRPQHPRENRARYWGLFFAGVWLVFLVPVVLSAARRGGWRDWLGIATLVGFAVCYLACVALMRRYLLAAGRRRPDRVRVLLAGLVLLAACALALLGADALTTAPYLAVTGVIVLRRGRLVWVVALAVVVEVLARLSTGWEHLDGVGFSVLAAGFAMWGIVLMMERNVQLVRSREAEAELAVETERVRFARDLHDVLGHSLTVITVKAELAGRLLEVDPQRAGAEVADLERLARDALADVRRTVAGYREITLPGELGRARATLAAAGIDASVTNAADAPPGELREVFAWAVREGVTNVVRHGSATACTVEVAPDSVTITDDGVGPPDGVPLTGNGLRGLRERAAGVGARVVTGSVRPHGFSLSVVAGPGTDAGDRAGARVPAPGRDAP